MREALAQCQADLSPRAFSTPEEIWGRERFAFLAEMRGAGHRARMCDMTTPLTTTDLATRTGFTARYWTRRAARGEMPGAFHLKGTSDVET